MDLQEIIWSESSNHTNQYSAFLGGIWRGKAYLSCFQPNNTCLNNMQCKNNLLDDSLEVSGCRSKEEEQRLLEESLKEADQQP